MLAGGSGWAIVPLAGARLAEVDISTVAIPQVPDYNYYHYH